jgi:hypothetical protein
MRLRSMAQPRLPGVRCALRAVLTALVATGAAQASSPPPLPAWLSGCWQGEGRSAGITEAWTNGRIGRMLGLGQTLRGARGSFEFMQIATAADAALVFIAQPGARPPVQFRAVTVEPARIVFANPDHDAPKTIEYRRDGDRLLVLLDAAAADAPPSFTFRRTGCDSQFASPTVSTSSSSK